MKVPDVKGHLGISEGELSHSLASVFSLDAAPAQQARVNLLFKCPTITFSTGNAGEQRGFCKNPPREQNAAWFVFLFVCHCLRREQRAVTLGSQTASSDNAGHADTKISVNPPPGKATGEPENQ